MSELKIGLKGVVKTVVGKHNCAITLKSGDLNVFATPAMVALMEQSAVKAIKDVLLEGSTTVGTKIDIAHTRATPIGMLVTAESTLVEIDGRRLVFKTSASDEKGVIGEGTHERFIVDREKFLSNL